MRPFHIAFPVHNLAIARAFYGGVVGCPEGRSATSWVDFDLYGHQIVAHLDRDMPRSIERKSVVDGQGVPVPHFGVVLDPLQWDALAARLKAADIQFLIEPTVRFPGEVGEQSTMFLFDPSGNALEFKAFADDSKLFAS